MFSVADKHITNRNFKYTNPPPMWWHLKNSLYIYYRLLHRKVKEEEKKKLGEFNHCLSYWVFIHAITIQTYATVFEYFNKRKHIQCSLFECSSSGYGNGTNFQFVHCTQTHIRWEHHIKQLSDSVSKSRNQRQIFQELEQYTITLHTELTSTGYKLTIYENNNV